MRTDIMVNHSRRDSTHMKTTIVTARAATALVGALTARTGIPPPLPRR